MDNYQNLCNITFFYKTTHATKRVKIEKKEQPNRWCTQACVFSLPAVNINHRLQPRQCADNNKVPDRAN